MLLSFIIDYYQIATYFFILPDIHEIKKAALFLYTVQINASVLINIVSVSMGSVCP